MNQVVRIREHNGRIELQVKLWGGSWFAMKTTKNRDRLNGELRTNLPHDFAIDLWAKMVDDCEAEGWRLSVVQESRRLNKRTSQIESQIPPENKFDLMHARQIAAEELGYYEFVIRIQPIVDDMSRFEAYL